MLEFLFLLLPISAAYGWYMGRRNLRQKQNSQQKKMSRDYFTGLNFLLSNESDKAVDIFISMLDVDDQTIDTHLSLGSLFRKRGEVERSIRIHQNLIARPSLPYEQRDLAMMELGKDYMAAGFFDRAEEIFLNLVSQEDHSEEAENQLISTYQITKEWQKAIDISKRLPRKRQQKLKHNIAHFYCELAAEATDENLKTKQLNTALKHDPHCGRALLELIQIYLKNDKNSQAEHTFQKLIDADAELFVDALPDIEAFYLEATPPNITDLKTLLAEAIAKGAGASVVIALAKLMIATGEENQAEAFVMKTLYRHPTMRGFQHLMHMHIKQAEAGQARDSLAMLEKLVEQQIKARPSYQCRECGFSSHTLYWHCPSCKNWGSIKRIYGLDGE